MSTNQKIICIIFFMGFVLAGCEFSLSFSKPTPTPTLTPTATQAPTNTPRPTITPTPKPPRFFTETFDQKNQYWDDFLVSGNDELLEITNKEGKLIFNLKSSYIWDYYLYLPEVYKDVQISATYDNLGQNINNVSLICRFDPTMGWYEFNISNGGMITMYYAMIKPDKNVEYKDILDTGSTLIHYKGTNNVTITCRGDYLTLYINDGLVVDHQIPSIYQKILRGSVGISVSSFDWYPVVIAFDEVTISEP